MYVSSYYHAHLYSLGFIRLNITCECLLRLIYFYFKSHITNLKHTILCLEIDSHHSMLTHKFPVLKMTLTFFVFFHSLLFFLFFCFVLFCFFFVAFLPKRTDCT